MQQVSRDDDPEETSAVVGPSKPRLLRVLGPGLITGASDDDPSGIATYAQAGAAYGYGFGWTLLYSYPLMAAVQMISARIGRTTGHGIAGVLQRHAPAGLLRVTVTLLVIANTVNLGADLGAMADAATLLLPGAPRWLLVLLFAGICVVLQMLLAYSRYVAVLKWLTLALFAYFAALATTRVDWRAFALGTLLPRIGLDREALTTVVAIFGTTISPYLFFWQSSQEAEDLHVHPRRRELIHAPEQGRTALHRIEVDTLAGMAVSNLVALAILGTAAAALHAHGTVDIRTSAEAAAALRPIAGPFAETVFALGVVGVGLLAVPVLAGSSAYAVGEAWRWPVGYARRVQEAKAFYGVVGLATLVGMLISLTPSLDPVRALFWSAVLNGVVAVPVMAVMMWVAARPEVMGRFAVTGWLKGLGWLATAVMAVAVVGMVATSL
ncbi:natural resistance-associated macrophage protein [Methylobacterium sp. 4-46]|uniref:NRAMP family divalent metal transporter n=1 Tax=unclassified Methylobacterium TaxID=2615210 RepID=UPI000152D1D5|nr:MULTISPECIES: divalent metal cation transporter [Methylobacterium]ACA21164.1 natural resistance-associated macrophage protein [Methylobacterium sp. 4-46]WFT80310.1 divalent metal cation transporter [Methylobacterium nodulans]